MRRSICLSLVLAASSCTFAKNLATGAINAATKCGRNRTVELEVDKALSSENAETELDSLASNFNWDTVACAVRYILNSLTAGTQDNGELGARSSEVKARRAEDQPRVDRGLNWLQKKR